MQFCADLSKISKSLKAIYMYVSERSRYALSGNRIVYYPMTYCFRDIRVGKRRNFFEFLQSIIFDILIANISWAVGQTPVNHIIFWKSVMRTFRCIYRNFFSFLLKSAQNFKKCTFLDNLRTLTQEENMETRQKVPFFSSTLPLCL